MKKLASTDEDRTRIVASIDKILTLFDPDRPEDARGITEWNALRRMLLAMDDE